MRTALELGHELAGQDQAAITEALETWGAEWKTRFDAARAEYLSACATLALDSIKSAEIAEAAGFGKGIFAGLQQALSIADCQDIPYARETIAALIRADERARIAARMRFLGPMPVDPPKSGSCRNCENDGHPDWCSHGEAP